MNRLPWLWGAALACAVATAGCGLILDTQPPDAPEDSGSGEPDNGSQDGDVPACVGDDDCQDNSICNGRETCVRGQCVGTDVILACDDNIACTEDTCDPQAGCVHTPNDGLCATGELCTEGTGCAPPPRCVNAADCGTQNACLDLWACVNNQCQRGERLQCPTIGACLVGRCLAGACVYVPDSDRCPTRRGCLVSTCQADGSCSDLIPDDTECDDRIDCTDDRCMTQGTTGRCLFLPQDAHCEDGVECTYNFCDGRGDDPTADDEGCAIRLNDERCNTGSDPNSCLHPVCTPEGCGDWAEVQACPGGGVCNVWTGSCEFPMDCEECERTITPCGVNRCDSTGANECVPPPDGYCPSTTRNMIGYCDQSGLEPECRERWNSAALPDVPPPLVP